MPPLSRRRTIIINDNPALDEMRLGQASEIHNVNVAGQRTSLRLRGIEWESLRLIAQREGCDLSHVVTEIDKRRGDTSLAGALRLFAIAYFRELLRLKEDVAGFSPVQILQALAGPQDNIGADAVRGGRDPVPA